ncbi:hypothetical protein RSOLAG1IB_12609 [Rhizoctonia solani AG-1 IB]|uniref:Uncharacterized protein n=1 Tax=Thanatephorus cucumeris (strain AG1-IB / isolate 7/3/14) TaxID=1108050 RepID=A0A0B7FYY9_THACB|nr:hypothetical protein RSOLAG1IB_12609 [Rhizoctonia solani AG-1 IB]
MIKITPPKLPDYLSGMYDLMPVMGKPTEEQLKTIHAVIRTQNSISHVPTLSNPDLSMQLSQHLFDAQMAVHHFNYPVSEIRETKKIHVPPKLPPDIPEELHNVIGPPTDEQMKAVHHALRCVEDRSNG